MKKPKKLFIVISGIMFLAIILLTRSLFDRDYVIKPIFKTQSHYSKVMSYHTNIRTQTEENKNFRHVLFTGPKSQLVVMSIPPGGEVGRETHRYTEQTLFFVSGTGEAELDGEKFPIVPGDVVVVTAGTQHNFRNTGTEDLKIYTVYAPPNHIDGRIHKTKIDADADVEDEAVGETQS